MKELCSFKQDARERPLAYDRLVDGQRTNPAEYCFVISHAKEESELSSALISLNNLFKGEQNDELLELFERYDIFQTLISLSGHASPRISRKAKCCLISFTSCNPYFVQMFSEYGLFRLVGEWLLDLDQQVVCDGLCVLLNSVKTSPLFVKRAERLVTPAIVERLETFEDLSIQRKLAKFCARMIRLSKTPAFVRDMISRVEKLIHSTDIEVLDNILYDVCEGIASTKSDLLCQWARSLIQDLKSSRQDPPLKWICMIAGKLYEQGIDPGFQTKELLDMIQLEDKDLRKVVYWCLSCGVAKGRLDDNMILDYVLSLEVSIDNYGVAVECAYLCLVLLEKLTDQRLFEILDQHLVDRLVHFLMIEEGSVRAKVFQVLHRVSRSQLVIEEYNQGKMKTVLAELEKAQDLQEALEVRALIQAITGTTPVYEGESSDK